jgi:hypothetical protein
MAESQTLFLEITAGDLKGTRAALREGFSIGRKKGSLTIRDSKLSGLHVMVEQRQDGSLWLVDAGSQNGIKTDTGRARELKLEAGITFTLGRTDFRIMNSIEAAETGVQPVVEATVTRDWWHWIQGLAERGQVDAKGVTRDVIPFDPVVKLKIIRGTQTGTEWTLGYGPRMIGSASVDLTLDDISLPGICFSLTPQDHGVLFRNQTEKEVKVNGKWVESGRLRDGDLIDIHGIQIQVVIDAIT